MLLALLLSTATFVVKQVDRDSKDVRLEPILASQLKATRQNGEAPRKGSVITCKINNVEDEKTHEKFTVFECNDGAVYLYKQVVLQVNP